MAPGLSSPLSFLPLPLSPPLLTGPFEDSPNLLTPTLSGGGTLTRGICGSGLPGPPLVAPAPPRWASLETAWGCCACHPPSSPAPQAPLGSRGTRDRKEALCLGRGRPGTVSKGPPPGPRMWRDFETPGTRVPAGCAELPELVLPLSAPQSLLGRLPAPPRTLQPVMAHLCLSTVALESTPSPASWPSLLPCSVGFLWANPRVKESGEFSSPSSPRGAQIPVLHPQG